MKLNEPERQKLEQLNSWHKGRAIKSVCWPTQNFKEKTLDSSRLSRNTSNNHHHVWVADTLQHFGTVLTTIWGWPNNNNRNHQPVEQPQQELYNNTHNKQPVVDAWFSVQYGAGQLFDDGLTTTTETTNPWNNHSKNSTTTLKTTSLWWMPDSLSCMVLASCLMMV